MDRGQASLTAVEAALGILLLFGVTVTFALGTTPQPAAQTQLDAYADDTLTILTTEQPRHSGQTRLAELTSSSESFEREKGELKERIERILPPNVLFRVETTEGSVGHRLPSDVATGVATVSTRNGPVTLRVWYV